MNNRIWLATVFLAGILLGTSVERIAHGQPARAASMGGSCQMPMSRSSGDSDMMAAMMGMMKSTGAMAMTGDQDRDFMVMMISHHQAAVQMARVEVARGKRPELITVARNVISSQNKEIAQMEEWLHMWYGEANPQPHVH